MVKAPHKIRWHWILRCTLAFGTAISILAPVGAEAEGRAAAYINKEIDSIAHLFGDGLAIHDRTRNHLLFGNLFNSSGRDAVAFFTLNGVDLTNGHEEYLAVFARGQGRQLGDTSEKLYRLISAARIGGRWARTLDWSTAHIKNRQIIIDGLRWDKNDAGCCPTIPIRLIFKLPETPAGGGGMVYPLLRETETARQQPRTKE